MEWVLVVIILLLLRSRRRARRDREGPGRRRGGRGRAALQDVTLPDGRTVLSVEGSLFAPTTADEPGWTWVRVEGTADTQLQHTTTVEEVVTGSGNAGGGRVGTIGGAVVEAVPVILVPTGRRRRVVAVDAYATGGRLGHLPSGAVARHGEALRAVLRVEGRPAGVEGRILRGPGGALRTEVLLPDGFEPTPPR